MATPFFPGAWGLHVLAKALLIGAPAWQRTQSGYAVLVFIGLPALLITGFGWVMQVGGVERSGAYAACVGTLALFAAVAFWTITGGYFPG